jgi:dipeptidase
MRILTAAVSVSSVIANPFQTGYNPQAGVIAEIGCTAIAVDSEASADGSAMAGMNVDCAQCDNRLTYIPSKDFSLTRNASRPVFANFGAYPRLVTKGRSSIYEPDNNRPFEEFAPIGEISQPAMKTFGYWESTLPLMNEAGLTIGESSCGTKLVGTKDSILDITELLRLAAERCSTARCAVDTMGSLSEKYGFMAMKNEITPGTEADGIPAYDDAGEAVLLADETGEAWVFHITGGFEGVSKSTWAARRVPKGHVTVLSNTFTIGDLPAEPNEDYRFNKNIRETARAASLWTGEDSEPLHFTRTFGMDIITFQRAPTHLPIPLYTSLRTWRVYDLIAPSLKLPVNVDNGFYPFSVKPDRPVSHRDLFKILGDYYQGSEFDMTEGILAGPFGTPYRFEGGNAKGFAQSPRAISIPRTSYSVLGQSKKNGMSVAWFAIDQPMTSVFVPLLSKVKSEHGIDESYQRGNLLEFDRQSAFWAFDFVSNWMVINWRNSSAEDVFPKQQMLQDRLDTNLSRIVSESSLSEADLASWQREVQKGVVSDWWKLADRLIVKYNDGYMTRVDLPVPIVGKSYGIPDWYSTMIGQTADVHPVWVRPVQESYPSVSIADKNSLPEHYQQENYQYPVPKAFDFTNKEWIMDQGHNTPAAGEQIVSGFAQVAHIAISALVGVLVGFFAARRRGGFKNEPLLG